MRRTDPSNKNRPEGNTNTLPPPTYTRIYPRCFNSTVIYMCRCPALNPRKLHKQLRVGRFSDLFPFRRLPIHVQTVAVETKVLKLTAAGTVPDSHGIPS